MDHLRWHYSVWHEIISYFSVRGTTGSIIFNVGQGKGIYLHIKKVLNKNVNPNAPGYRVAVLQVAVANGDLVGVQALLEAGAEPNATGDPQGSAYPERTFEKRFNELHGLSPILINRRHAEGKPRVQVPSVISQVEALLLQYGG
jgi:hypothetical protein